MHEPYTPYANTIASELSLDTRAVEAALSLLAEGATVPFIARYRKERTAEMDEQTIRSVRDRAEALAALGKRKAAVRDSLVERGLLSNELDERLTNAGSLTEVEDIYLPYRPKRKTKASVAEERGLKPLAEALLAREVGPVLKTAREFVDPELGVPTVQDALDGARDIIAEMISTDAAVRGKLRSLFEQRAVITSTLKRGVTKEAAQVYRDYFDWREPVRSTRAHRIHAVLRAEREGYLTVHVVPDEEEAIGLITKRYVGYHGPQANELSEACIDAYKRLLRPSLENERKAALKAEADAEAVSVFAANLRELLLAPPLGRKAVMGVDPGFRTGCKVVCLDPSGELLFNTTIYPLEPQRKIQEASEEIVRLIKLHRVEAVAVGNGTGGREAEEFVRGVVSDKNVVVVTVNEAGASVYSASEAAREEFPDHDVTVRGAVSIGRRLMDPLSELVKIDPKSIGVGQYQHDVDQALLESALSDTVVSCVNAVGVELNTASPWLLSYVSGLSERSARAIVGHRRAHGAFAARSDLLSVKGIGEKAFQLASGFLRITGASNPLDASAVHPERYDLVKRIARSLNSGVDRLIGNAELVERIDVESFVDDTVGLPTLTDIRAELLKPGRDPRSTFEPVAFLEHVREIEDVREGMKLPGVVTNVTAFGAFVDIGVHRDGLIHISRLAERYVSDPKEIVHVGQHVNVTVVEVDMERKRIGLSLVD